MISKKDIIFTVILTINLFLLSFFYSRNVVNSTEPAVFRTSRTYGFPLTVFSISRSTQEYSEAKEIYSKSNYELLNRGWNLDMGTENINFPLAILLNFISSLVFSIATIGIFNALIFAVIKKVRRGYC